MRHRGWIVIGGITGALAVALGAFGAHGLSAALEASGRAGTFDTAVQYHLVHALALVLTGLLAERLPGRWTQLAGGLFTAGVILFSGSLYILAVFNLGFMGAVAPFGGAALTGGWLCLALAAWAQR
ncbi:MAG: DUF423 domain-containing protein [Aggregatilineales bacterium]